MGDKFRRAVNAPHKIMGKVRRKIEATKPETPRGRTLRGVGLATADLFRFLLWATKYVALDNHLMRAIEKELRNMEVGKNKAGKDKAFSAALKKYPDLAAFIIYYLMVAMTLGGVRAYQEITEDDISTENVTMVPRPVDDFKIDPNVSDEEWRRQIDAIHPYVMMETILSEGFVPEMYSDVGQTSGYLTIGSGYMVGQVRPTGKIGRSILKERKAFFKKVLGRPLLNGTKINYAENQVLMTAWYKQRVYPQLRRALKKPIGVRLFVELAIAAYNRGEGIYKTDQDGYPLMRLVNFGANDTVIANAFSCFFKDGNAGLRPKYGIAAHRVLGDISDADVLNALANAVYKVSDKKLWNSDGTLKLKEPGQVAELLLAVKNADIVKNGRTYRQNPVREYLTAAQVKTILAGGLFEADTASFVPAPAPAPVQTPDSVNADRLNEEGEELYDNGDYAGAVEKFKAALAQNPRQYIVYSNLSIAYYKMGDFDSGLRVVQDLIKSEHMKNMPDNLKAYSYYNAALCYEGLADQEKDLAEKLNLYDRARKNAGIAEHLLNTTYKSFNNRIEKKIKAASGRKTKSKQTQKRKRAFNEASKKLRNNAHSAGFDVADVLSRGAELG